MIRGWPPVSEDEDLAIDGAIPKARVTAGRAMTTIVGVEMNVVSITRWARPVEQEVADLAPLVGQTPYDLKLRLAGPLPVVFSWEAELGRTRQLLATLRERGHGAVACDLAYVAACAEMCSPRSYELGEGAFKALNGAWGQRLLPYAELAGLIHARATSIEETSSVHKDKRFSLGKAVMTGGLAVRKTTTKKQLRISEDSEQTLYLIRKDGRDPMILQERRLRYQGLGKRTLPTSGENFATLVQELRNRAPQALYDNRLLTRPRKNTLASWTGTSAHHITSSSNASDNDLAAHLIVVAHLQGQL